MNPVKPTTIPLPDGKKIDDLRWDRRMSIPQLATEVGVTRQYMGRICKGQRGASLEVQKRIAKVLEVTLEKIQQEPS